MHSMRNFEDVKDRLIGTLTDAEPASPAAPAVLPVEAVATVQ